MPIFRADGQRTAAHSLWAVGCLLLALCGCTTVSPKPGEPLAVEVPAAWSDGSAATVTAAASLAQWWQRFDDPLLARLVVQALQANTSVRAAEAALRQARAQRDVSAAALLPTVGAAASAERGRSGGQVRTQPQNAPRRRASTAHDSCR